MQFPISRGKRVEEKIYTFTHPGSLKRTFKAVHLVPDFYLFIPNHLTSK
jgi:hypothetical protein